MWTVVDSEAGNVSLAAPFQRFVGYAGCCSRAAQLSFEALDLGSLRRVEDTRGCRDGERGHFGSTPPWRFWDTMQQIQQIHKLRLAVSVLFVCLTCLQRFTS